MTYVAGFAIVSLQRTLTEVEGGGGYDCMMPFSYRIDCTRELPKVSKAAGVGRGPVLAANFLGGLNEMPTVEFDATFLHRTALAVKVDLGNFLPNWIPKSVVEDPEEDELDDLEPGESFTMFIKEWFALDEGLI